ncbi:MAG: hypothetical protein HY226_04205 [Candidatus Vogelbacteria bacterium]|nr:hypothetical protein [Candidatus Vogelbacteria bacterium]
MLSSLSDLFGSGATPAGLPTKEGVAIKQAMVDRNWQKYFGENYFHDYWHGGDGPCSHNDPCGAGSIVYGGNVVSVLILIIFSFVYYNGGISNQGYGIWLSVAALLTSISLGVPILSTWWNRGRIYQSYFKQYSNPRVWNQTLLPVVRGMVANKYDPIIADHEASLKHFQASLERSLAEKEYASSPENPVTDRGATLEKIDKILLETRTKISMTQAKIGDVKITKDLALGKIDEVEAETTQMTRGDDSSKIDVLGVVNRLAKGAGLTPVAVPSDSVDQAILVNRMTRDEIRKVEAGMPKVIKSKDEVGVSKIKLPTSGTAVVKA